jgi:hypothetical protein
VIKWRSTAANSAAVSSVFAFEGGGEAEKEIGYCSSSSSFLRLMKNRNIHAIAIQTRNTAIMRTGIQ